MPHRPEWTVATANAALPAVTALLDEAAKALGEMREAQEHLRDLHILHGDAVRAPGHPAHAEAMPFVVRMQEARGRLADAVGRIEGMHVELKDIDQGLVDFRGRVGERAAYLCWRRGEPAVTHWHELDAGFAGRKPLPSLAGP